MLIRLENKTDKKRGNITVSRSLIRSPWRAGVVWFPILCIGRLWSSDIVHCPLWSLLLRRVGRCVTRSVAWSAPSSWISAYGQGSWKCKEIGHHFLPLIEQTRQTTRGGPSNVLKKMASTNGCKTSGDKIMQQGAIFTFNKILNVLFTWNIAGKSVLKNTKRFPKRWWNK